jgi:hypothetical protein
MDTANRRFASSFRRPALRSFPFLLVSLGVLAMHATAEESVSFAHVASGAMPPGWVAGLTGRGAPKWSVESDASSPGTPKVLKQSGSATFAWCVNPSVAIADGFIEARFRPVAGKEDQAGGVVWRWKDGERYYVARGNALENNVSLYYTEGGSRKTIRYVDAPVARNEWHVLRVEFAGSHIRVILDGVPRIELDDAHIAGPGAVGVWTKADSVTLFDGIRYGAAAK